MASDNNKRIAKNTIALYLRQVLILLVSLYTVRVVLDTLGFEDYGIYNVVGGVVMLFSFLSGTMTSATQRFFSFALGENDEGKLKKIFSVNLIIYAFIVIVALLLLESVGFWYVKEHLNVPTERYETVLFIFHFSVFIFIMAMMSAPFTAMLIAHEDMHLYAYISILEAMLKLGIVFLLVHINYDKLQLYSILTFSVAVVNLLLYVYIGLKRYKECQFRKFYWDGALFKQIVNFTGWTLFGQITTVVRNQAVTVLINQFFNPVVVAARAVAISISSKVNMFSASFNTSLYPPIIKAYSSGDRDGMFALVFNGSKMTFFLMWVFAFPMLLEMDTILGLWLKEVPEQAVLFARLALIESLILSISYPLATAARAPGKMKIYELTLGIMQLMIFVIAWFALRQGAGAESVFIVAIVVNVLMFAVRLCIVSNLTKLPIKRYIFDVAMPLVLIVLTSFAVSFTVQCYLPEGFLFSFIVILLGVMTSSVSMYFFGLNKDSREKVILIIGVQVNKLFRNNN